MGIRRGNFLIFSFASVSCSLRIDIGSLLFMDDFMNPPGLPLLGGIISRDNARACTASVKVYDDL